MIAAVAVARAGFLLLLAAPLATGRLSAQERSPEPGPYARIVTIAPKPGQAAAFEAGYARHIEWHRANGDRWTWYGWSFVLGPRLGRFMDGTFGHAISDLDDPVDPAGDRADNARNVTPHADFVSHGVYRRLDEAGVGALLPDTSAYLVLVRLVVAPGRTGEFESAIRERRRMRGDGEAGPRSWYRLELGGEGPEYLLMHGAPTWDAAIRFSAAVTPAFPADLVERVTTELLRYRPQHSYHP